ncbi:MAG TPA: hypothetical protein VK919_03215 [Solirubrobacterales bacterium]|nr:hypothetical protein [Solirubrobacterales bacterium]
MGTRGTACDRRRRRFGLGAIAIACALAGPALAGPGGVAGARAGAEITRYSLAGGCYALRSEAAGRFAVRDGGGYRASAESAADAERFRMQATALGRYLLYERAERFLAVAPAAAPSAGEPSNATDLTVEEADGGFTISSGFNGRQLAARDGGELVSVPAGSAGAGGRFSFEPASGCASYPEVEVNVSGEPFTGEPRFGEVSGFFEGHMHQMAFEFLGGRAHCGRPWHRFGAPYALVDCPDHGSRTAARRCSRTSSTATPPAATTRPAGRRSATGPTRAR